VELFLIRSNNVSPNAIRSEFNPSEFRLTPFVGRTNMSNEPRVEGWLGTTNDINETAICAIDTDKPDWYKVLVSAISESIDVEVSKLDIPDETEIFESVLPWGYGFIPERR